MINRYFYTYSLILLWVFATLIQNNTRSEKSDILAYCKLLTAAENKPAENLISTQAKQRVRKDIYLRNGPKCKHHWLTCEKANLVIMQENAKVKIYEVMSDIYGQITEDHSLRSFQANSGIYDYDQNFLFSEKLFFAMTSLLQKGSPDFFGAAQNAKIFFNNVQTNFVADKISAQIEQPGSFFR